MTKQKKVSLNVQIDSDVYKQAKKNAVDLELGIKEYTELALIDKNKEIKK